MNFLSKLKFYTIFKILNYGSNLVLNRLLGLLLLSLLTKNLDQYVVGQYFIFINLQTINKSENEYVFYDDSVIYFHENLIEKSKPKNKKAFSHK